LLLGIKTPKAADQLDHGHCDEALSSEAAWSEEANAQGHLEARAAQTGGVGDERDERAVGILHRYAEDQRGPYLRSEAQVDKPDLAPLR
jgi:hypothetical protein